jgi:hypothetical protein
MTTGRIGAAAVALSIVFGSVGGGGFTQGSANDHKSSSYCYDDSEPNCRRYGRLYTWRSDAAGMWVARKSMAVADR